MGFVHFVQHAACTLENVHLGDCALCTLENVRDGTRCSVLSQVTNAERATSPHSDFAAPCAGGFCSLQFSCRLLDKCEFE